MPAILITNLIHTKLIIYLKPDTNLKSSAPAKQIMLNITVFTAKFKVCFALSVLAILGLSWAEELLCPEVCNLAPEGGPCLGRKRFRMWYYDYDAGDCKKFSYGGCKGNRNRFWTSQECETMCGKCRDVNVLPVDTQEGNFDIFYLIFISPNNCWKSRIYDNDCSLTDFCQMPVEQGKCDPGDFVSPTIKWYFDVKEDKCKVFAYAGCNGNANRFDSQEDCENLCNN